MKQTRQEIKDEFNEYYDTWTSLSKKDQNRIVDAYIKLGGMHQAYNSVVDGGLTFQ